MKVSLLYPVIFFSIILLINVQIASGTAARPFPQHITYATGTIKPNHRTQAQLDNDVAVFYTGWKTRFLVQVSAPLPARYRIAMDIANGSDRANTVSEGQGYGMIIFALMAGFDPNAKAIFDGLYYFVQANPSGIDTRLMTWKVPIGTSGNDSAFDGDADIAFALLLADAQWGSTGEPGQINYLSEARTMITAIKESTIGPDSHLPMLGDWVDPYDPYNTDPTDEYYNQYTNRPSDYMPSHFRAYHQASGDGDWLTVYNAVLDSISTIQTWNPTTGLVPDFIEPVSGSNNSPQPVNIPFLEGDEDDKYYYNAGRVPFRIGVDALLSNNGTSKLQAQKLANWIEDSTGGDPSSIKGGYSLDGTMIGNYFSTFFAAPFGVALMTTPAHQVYLNNLYNLIYTTPEDYFEDTINLLCLLVMSGNYWNLEKAESRFLPAVNYLLLR